MEEKKMKEEKELKEEELKKIAGGAYIMKWRKCNDCGEKWFGNPKCKKCPNCGSLNTYIC